ncbi:CRISPR-associated endonuclease Cas2 [Candidatus Protofrankia californiensis]|uniref:CRISPR-associated endonuclease Cas2 n=1 Tax=Candidatus Protofrankia californiensis TaxID=1839754 RepID=UPI001040FD69|nr:CRISPR-associated endonuclease Cas2 [Candidatus Protofrankia californiensis]
MTEPDGRFLVSFDVSSDRRRRKVATALERHGPKVLRSVYDLDLSVGRLDRLAARLTGLVEPDDHIVIVPYCPRCRQ